MKRAHIVSLCLIIILITCSAELSFAQRWLQVATSDFKWEGDFWKAELGAFAADFFTQSFRIRRSSFYQDWNFLDLELANKLLSERGVEQAFDADPRQITDAFWVRNVRLFFAGHIEKMVQTADVDGSVQLRIRLELKIFDVQNGYELSTDWIENRIRLEKKIQPGDPFDKDLARKLLSGVFNRAESTVSNALSRARIRP